MCCHGMKLGIYYWFVVGGTDGEMFPAAGVIERDAVVVE